MAIWRTRHTDAEERATKKRKLTDETYTDVIALTSEVNFLRVRHDDDVKRLQASMQETVRATHQVQALQVQLALEIGK